MKSTRKRDTPTPTAALTGGNSAAASDGAGPPNKVFKRSDSGASENQEDSTASVDANTDGDAPSTSMVPVDAQKSSTAKETNSTGNKSASSRASTPNPSLSAQKKKKGRPPKLDTSPNPDADLAKPSLGSTKSTSTPTTAQDQHPYARSAVIEVWHGVEDPTENSWWSEESDEEGLTSDLRAKDQSQAKSEESDEKEGSSKEASSTTNEESTSSKSDESDNNDENEANQPKNILPSNLKPKEGTTPSVRLCDIIDRVSTGDGEWRYYVHYKDFNRRMDEWISVARIVSPPSVGNAKARAIKKEEEKQKRKQAREEEKKAVSIIDVTAPRASRRRSTQHSASSTMDTQSNDGGASSIPAASTGVTAAETPRTRRRKSIDDDATVVMGNSEGGGGGADPSSTDAPAGPLMAAEKGIVALPTEAVHTHAVGEHIVETIAAQELDEHEGLDEASLREHEEVTKVKNVAFVELGAFQMEAWYFSPLPKELLSDNGLIEVLYVCEFTFGLFSRKSELQRFQSRLPVHARHPPGNEIYRKGNLSMFEVDGFEERIYCQNLCYIAKLFLDHKTLYFDVDPFLFYVLCEVDDRGFHPVGYYSKEKYSDVGYNLACILTFPCHQRKGYGRFLIAFSYELSKKEEKVGSPEKPMSDLGQQAYKPYWASTIVDFLLNQEPEASSMSIMDISKITSIMAEDIVFTLNQLGILKIINGVYFIAAEEGMLKTLAKKYPVKEPRVDPTRLHWSPFVTDVKRDKFSIHSKKPSVEGGGSADVRGSGGFP